jgi:hypothetical protein
MRFGDLIFHQIQGVTMGMSPAPNIANLYVAIYGLTHILPLLDKYLPFYKRFIDNGFAIWLHSNNLTTNANNWADFKTIVNGSGLKWMFENPCKKLVFMNMTIQIEAGKIVPAICKTTGAISVHSSQLVSSTWYIDGACLWQNPSNPLALFQE